MIKSFLKYILPNFIINLILKFCIKLIRIKSFETSQAFWNENTVSSPKMALLQFQNPGTS